MDTGKTQKLSKEQIINLMIMGILSLFLLINMSLGPLTPIPIVLMFLALGFSRGFAYLGILTLVTLGVGFSINSLSAIIPIMFILALSGFLGQSIIQKVQPLKIFKQGMLGVLTVFILFTGIKIIHSEKTIEGLQQLTQQEIVKNTEELKKNLKTKELNSVSGIFDDYFKFIEENSGMLAKQIVTQYPFFMVLFATLLVWGNLICTLFFGRNGALKRLSYPYAINSLLSFKVPELMIWPFILALAVYLLESYAGPIAMIISTNFLKISLIFYVIHGFGILVELFNLAKIKGFIRILFFLLVIAQGPFIFALLGLFDMWIDFRTFFKKKIEKYRGDN